MLPELLLLASEGAGAAMEQSIARIFHTGILIVGIVMLIGGIVLLAKRNPIGGFIACLVGFVLTACGGYALAT